MSQPTVSVIMACYNGADLLDETIGCVLRQTLTDFELIVVDDCSTDHSRDVLAGWRDSRVRVLCTPHNMGPVGARNLAVAHATGRYLAAWDQDDLCAPARFARQVDYLESHRTVVAVGSASRVLTGRKIRPNGSPARTTPDFLRWMMHFGNPLVWSSMMIRGEAARALTPFSRDERRYAEDFDLYHRLARLGDVARLDEVLTTYRSHPGGASNCHRVRMQASALAVLEEAYAPWFGTGAKARAGLVIKFLAERESVPDLGTLGALAEALSGITDAFCAQYGPDAESRALIALAMSRHWWRAARTGLRTGRLTLRDVQAQRPCFAARPDLGARELASSRFIGWVRGKREHSKIPGWHRPILQASSLTNDGGSGRNGTFPPALSGG